MPAVTVFSSPKGAPMAMTHSPTRSLPTSPVRTKGRPVASIFSTAISVRSSLPKTLALNWRLSVSLTVTSSAPSTTWALVITTPSAERIKPEPLPRGSRRPLSSSAPPCCSGCWPPRGMGKASPKKRRKKSSIMGSLPPKPPNGNICAPPRLALRAGALTEVSM